MTSTVLKHSYTVPCASAFRIRVEQLAARRNVNVGDLARSILLVVPADVIAAYPDPGEPGMEDRETIVLKSGPAQGRPWRRKPRLQVRLPPGHEVPLIRQALALALAMDGGEQLVRIGDARPAPVEKPVHEPLPTQEVADEMERLQTIISVLAFEPLPQGVKTRGEALHVLGFPPGAEPDLRKLRAKFRMLATIHHPDSLYGSHLRMSQLNQAMDLLRGE
ncbi:MAG TPA: J domain-containing protein [Rhodospirillaceae bacterium]|nr:J domain-containing protein [Rhodospirillaceae bacterium]